MDLQRLQITHPKTQTFNDKIKGRPIINECFSLNVHGYSRLCIFEGKEFQLSG